MARDAIGERYEKRKKRKTLEDLTQRTRSTEDIEAEQAVLDKARQERVKDPEKYRLKGERTVGRNDPCPCGSGKKFKKCCGAGK